MTPERESEILSAYPAGGDIVAIRNQYGGNNTAVAELCNAVLELAGATHGSPAPVIEPQAPVSADAEPRKRSR